MLEDFKNNSFYNYAKNINKYFHAYLFEVNDLEESYPLILAFAKTILCKNHYKDNKKCGKCNKCLLIDKGYNEDLKVIEPITSIIKKEQILELKNKFSLKSSNDNNRVYIIKQAECMNLSASNSLLKFIEEPEDGVYGILITINRRQLLETIISRCVLISLKEKQKYDFSKEEFLFLTSFFYNIIHKKENELPYIKIDFLNTYDTRDKILNAFNICELIFDDLINTNYNKESIFSKEICDIINKSLGDVSVTNIILITDVVIRYRNKLTNIINMNLNLFMDRFLIDVSEVIE